MLDRAGETGKDEVLEMKRVEKLYMIEITESDAGKLARFCDNEYREFAKSYGESGGEVVRSMMDKAKEFRDFFASLIDEQYMGE